MSTKWGQADHYSAPLYRFMQQATIGRTHDPSIYIVRCDQEAIYIGKTTQGVYNRLWRHVTASSYLGYWLIDHEFDSGADAYELEAISIVYSLDAAERYLISTLHPVLNVIEYRKAIPVPPSFVCPIMKVDLSHVPTHTHSLFYSTPYFQEKQIESDLSKLYEKACRDPSHPYLRAHSSDMDVFYYQRVRRMGEAL